MTKPTNDKRGFTLIELLTVIAIVAILSAILVPTVGQFRTLAKRTSDSTDLRNIVQASQLLAAQNGERFVGENQQLGDDGIVEGTGNTIVDVAAILAYGGELNDPQNWVSANEQNRLPSTGGGLYTASDPDETTGIVTYDAGTYSEDDFSYSYVTGLQTSDPSTTPVAFTRLPSDTASSWATGSPYGNDGGHVAFLGGNVSWYETLTGVLISPTGDGVDTIPEAIPTGAIVRQSSD